MQVIPVFGLVVAAILAVFVGFQLVGPLLCDYRLSERGLELLFFGHLPVRLVPLRAITEVTGDIGKWEYLLALRMGNRFVGQAVLVRTHRPLLWLILITPTDPEGFVRRFWDLKGPSANEQGRPGLK